ncbi:hypothetical protein BGZ83_006190 [Gryganskiella cystojenkinii]|nr:hypothetical protein BGZ83_006190 [Gryganskiella cystojenkinii]
MSSETVIVPTRSASTMATVFDIHLLQSTICSNLDPRSIYRCALVSRDFYIAFNPFIWSDIQIHRRVSFKRFMQPEAQLALSRHVSLITHVSTAFASIWPLLLRLQCQNLCILDSRAVPSRRNLDVNNAHVPSIIQLVQTCPRLHTIKLSHFTYNNKEMIDQFSQSLRQHPSIKSLDITGWNYYASAELVRTLLWSSAKLERLNLEIFFFGYLRRFMTDEELERLTKLSNQHHQRETVDPRFRLKELFLLGRAYDHEQGTVFEFLKRCPDLERVLLPEMYPHDCVPALVSLIQTHLPNLQHLDFTFMTANGSLVANVIKSCRRLRTFIGYEHPQTPQHIISALLEHQASTLETLQLYCNNLVHSSAVLRLLSSCPELQVLDMMATDDRWLSREQLRRRKMLTRYNTHGHVFLDPVMLTPRRIDTNAPWVCELLRVLRIRYTSIETIRESVPPSSSSGQGSVSEEEVADNFDPSRSEDSELEKEQDEDEEVLPRVFYERLGELTQLEDLRLKFCPGLTWSINSGTEDGMNPTTMTGMSENGNTISNNTENSTRLQEEDMSMRVTKARENMSRALKTFSGLKQLQKLELRGLKEYIDKDAVWRARRQWKNIQWVHFS